MIVRKMWDDLRRWLAADLISGARAAGWASGASREANLIVAWLEENENSEVAAAIRRGEHRGDPFGPDALHRKSLRELISGENKLFTYLKEQGDETRR